MRLGFHVSIAGGFRNIVARAQTTQSETIQLFSRNPRGWKYRPLDVDDISIFKKQIKESGIGPVFVHMPYLVNLASTNSELWNRSLDSLIADLRRSAIIGASFLIMHVGSASDKAEGMQRISDGINRALSMVQNDIQVLLENTAGSGTELGHTFEQLRTIIDRVEDKQRIGVVLDTAHAFEAGYDLRTEKTVAETIAEFNRTIGLERLHLIHFNDSKTECGSHRDRHWHITQGKIAQGMLHILHCAKLQHLPFIMETPRAHLKDDLMNMMRVKQLLDQTSLSP